MARLFQSISSEAGTQFIYTTFRSEIVHDTDRYYSVLFRNKNSTRKADITNIPIPHIISRPNDNHFTRTLMVCFIDIPEHLKREVSSVDGRFFHGCPPYFFGHCHHDCQHTFIFSFLYPFLSTHQRGWMMHTCTEYARTNLSGLSPKGPRTRG